MDKTMNAEWPDALEQPPEITVAGLKAKAADCDLKSRQLTASAQYCDCPTTYRDETALAVHYSRLSSALIAAAHLMESHP